MIFASNANQDIRQLAEEHGVTLSQIAAEYHVRKDKLEFALSRELPTSTKEDMVKVINRLSIRNLQKQMEREEREQNRIEMDKIIFGKEHQ